MIVQSSIPENSATGMIQYQGSAVEAVSCDCGDGVTVCANGGVMAMLAISPSEIVICVVMRRPDVT